MAFSIQNRLTIGLLVTLTVLLVAQWVLGSIAIRYLVEDLIEARMEHDIESVLGAVTVDGKGEPSLKSTLLNVFYQTPFSGHYYQIAGNGYLLRSRSLWDSSLSVAQVSVGQTHMSEQDGPAQQHLLVMSRGYKKGGDSLVIQLAEDLTLARKHIHKLQLYHAAFSLALIASLLLLQRRVIRNVLIPLDNIRHELTLLERGETDELKFEHPREVAPLVAEINQLLGVTRKRLQRSRRAAGNLAHGLKAPLAVLMQQADVPALRGDKQTADLIRNQAGVIRQLVDRELKRARLAGGECGHRTDIQHEIEPLIDTLRQIYVDKDIEIELDIPVGAISSMERMDMVEMLGNLLDNACKFAMGKIHLKYESTKGECWVIEDDGAGCSEEELGRLMQRGERLDETTDGHGLGLAIVQDIVVDYGGKITLTRSPKLGGLRVEVCV